MSEHVLSVSDLGFEDYSSCGLPSECLTTDCPGYELSYKLGFSLDLISAIDNKLVDFIDGVWCADNQHKVRSIMFSKMSEMK